LLLALALAAEQNAAVWVGVSFDPFDLAPAREKLLNGFRARRCSDLGRHDDLPSDRLLVRDAAHLGFRRRLKSETINRRETRQGRSMLPKTPKAGFVGFADQRMIVRQHDPHRGLPMDRTSDGALADPQEMIADLRRQLADAQRKLGERTAEGDESLEHQTATRDVLSVISQSGAELKPVFDMLVATAARICAANTAAIMRLQDGVYCLVSAFGVSQAWKELVTRHPVSPGRGTVTSLVALERRIVHVEDAMTDPEYGWKEAAQVGGFRTALGVPLLQGTTVIGVIALGRSRVEPFSDRQIELVRTFADQAVIAIENARLLAETKEALEQQTATTEVLQVINASPGDLALVFEAMLEKATYLCGASFGILWNFTGDLAAAGALHRVPEAYAELCRSPFRPSPGSGPARMMQGERGFALTDLAEYPPYLAGDALTRAIVELAGARSVIVEPLRKDAITLGAITLYRQEGLPFTDKQIALLQNFAAQAVIAMENARLLTETREALEQQTATAEVLRVISGSPTDLQPTFDAIARNATILSGAEAGGVFRFDGSLIHLAAHYGYGAEVVNAILREFSETSRPGQYNRACDPDAGSRTHPRCGHRS
jgi:GAF domain-containing protein